MERIKQILTDNVSYITIAELNDLLERKDNLNPQESFMLGVNVGFTLGATDLEESYSYDDFNSIDSFVENMMQKKSITEKFFTQSQVDGIMNAVLNLGMTLRQDQMNGYERRSGDEVLEDWKKENLEGGLLKIPQ